MCGTDIVYLLCKPCGKNVGQLRFDPKLGCVKTMYVKKDWQRQGYGREMVDKVRNDSLVHDLWCVTYKGHPFWSKIPDAKYMDPVDFQVDGGGYRFR